MVDKMFNISSEMTEDSKKTETEESKRRHLDPVFSEKFTETMAESVAASDQKFQDAMVREIEKNIKAVRVLVDAYTAEYDLLKEVITKSVAQKIHEVREEEKKKAEEAINQLALEHQAALNRAAEDL